MQNSIYAFSTSGILFWVALQSITFLKVALRSISAAKPPDLVLGVDCQCFCRSSSLFCTHENATGRARDKTFANVFRHKAHATPPVLDMRSTTNRTTTIHKVQIDGRENEKKISGNGTETEFILIKNSFAINLFINSVQNEREKSFWQRRQTIHKHIQFFWLFVCLFGCGIHQIKRIPANSDIFLIYPLDHNRQTTSALRFFSNAENRKIRWRMRFIFHFSIKAPDGSKEVMLVDGPIFRQSACAGSWARSR